jgi:phosphoribosylformylglycinamidine (FGAM) synthase PurS component
MNIVYQVTCNNKEYIASPWALTCFKARSYLKARGFKDVRITKYIDTFGIWTELKKI